MKFEGIMTALVTPLNKDGSVNEESFRKLIQFQLKEKVHSLLVLGGTGEYLALSNEQRKKAIDIAVDEVNGEVPVVVGLLSPGIMDNIYIGKYAKEAGADAYLAITPYYLTVSQQGIIDFYKKLDSELDMPVLLYNYPSKTNTNLEPQTVEKLVNELPNIVGIKECTYSMKQVTDLLRRVGNKITVYAGEEYTSLATLVQGAKGAIMASSNIIPSYWVKLWNLLKNGEYAEAVKLNENYFPVFEAVFKESNPSPLKYGLNLIGLPVGEATIPLTSLSEESKRLMEDIIKEFEIKI